MSNESEALAPVAPYGRARPARYLELWERAARREAEEEQAHQRQIEFDVEVPVGRKKDPMRVCQMGSLS